MDSDGPALRYYRSLLGAWAGALTFEVIDGRGLWSQPVSLALPLAWMGLAGRVLRSTTTLTARTSDERVFEHTTVVTVQETPWSNGEVVLTRGLRTSAQ